MKVAHYRCSHAPAPSPRAMAERSPTPVRTTVAPSPGRGHGRRLRLLPLRLVPLLALLALGLVACGGPETVRTTPPPGRTWSVVKPQDPVAANSVLMRAFSLVGTPYRYGGNTPESGFDCSGLVNYVFRDVLDVGLPRTSRELAAIQGPKIAVDRLTAADLVFFGTRGDITHVGIYVGEGRFVHAPRTGGTVRLDRLDGPYWRDHYTGAKRVLR